MIQGFDFTVTAEDGATAARSARLTTPRSVIETPAFMPVGTQATVKSQTPDELAQSGARIVLANTYHLMLRPTAELIDKLGGVQRFMAWPYSVLTDSGGYQVFSLAKLRKIDDSGVVFRSHINGELHSLTPERSMEIQALLGSDIAMVLDECPPGDAARPAVEAAVSRTTRWAERCLAAPTRADLLDARASLVKRSVAGDDIGHAQARFGIVQGGSFVDLRLAHLDVLAALPFDGIALGGFSVGESMEVTYGVLNEVAPRMPRDRPRYLMGVGKPVDLLRAIGSGIDMFDCVLPTRNARNAQALTWGGRVNLKQARHREDDSALDAQCECPVCKTFSRAYLRHLVVAGEMLGPRLITQHNLFFYQALMRAARAAIGAGRYAEFARQTEAQMLERDEVDTPR